MWLKGKNIPHMSIRWETQVARLQMLHYTAFTFVAVGITTSVTYWRMLNLPFESIFKLVIWLWVWVDYSMVPYTVFRTRRSIPTRVTLLWASKQMKLLKLSTTSRCTNTRVSMQAPLGGEFARYHAAIFQIFALNLLKCQDPMET